MQQRSIDRANALIWALAWGGGAVVFLAIYKLAQLLLHVLL